MEGRFLEGEVLTIRALADALGTSTMPVREALQRLGAERALDFLPNRSVRVPVMSHDRFVDLIRVRMRLEGFAAELAAENITKSEIDELDQAIHQMEAAAKSEDGDDFSAGNQHFHFIIYRASRSEHLVPMIETLWLGAGPFLASFVRRGAVATPLGRELADQEFHKQAVEALRKGDAAAARAAIEDDLSHASELYFRSHKFQGSEEEDTETQDNENIVTFSS
jgi:DNA-binding GntR family transcriptional regulator